MHIEQIISLVSISIAIISSLIGILFWYKATVEKRYASERDFQHVKNSISTLISNLAHSHEMQEAQIRRVEAELMQVKVLLTAILARSGESISEILNKRDL